ncbi:MAG: baseplate J/gp47 family protein [Anaerolineales bacterium]
MKLQILELDPSDDQASVRDKLNRVNADKVLLVWPRRGNPLRSRLDLTLIKRQARDMGYQLALVSHDPEVVDAARQVELPLFASTEAATNKAWPTPEGIAFPLRPNASGKRELLTKRRQMVDPGRDGSPLPGWTRAVIFGVGILSLLALAAALIPSAAVILEPDTTDREFTITVWLAPEDRPANASPLSIPANQRSTTLSVSGRVETAGSTRVPDERASGSLQFTNLTEEPVAIPAGTSVRASGLDGVRFVTTEAAQVEGGRGDQVIVPAQAAEPGPTGNVAAGEVDAVDGPLGLQLQVSNTTGFSGGTNRSQPTVTERDQRRLREQVEADLLQLAQSRLNELTPPDEELVPESVSMGEILELQYDAEAGQAAASLGLTMEADIRGLSYRIDKLQTAARREIPASDPGWRVVPGSLRILERATEFDGERLGIRAEMTWQEFQAPPSQDLRRAIAGLPAGEPWTAVEQTLGVQISRIELDPEWFPYYPWIPSRIDLTYPWMME